MTAPARPATLRSALESETPEGGRVRAWSDVATLWVTLARAAGSTESTQGAPPVRVETASAVARSHPMAAAGLQLVFDDGDPPWRLLSVRRDDPALGRMTMLLDRQL